MGPFQAPSASGTVGGRYRPNKYRPSARTGPPNRRRATLLEAGCIRNYPSTLERRKHGWIGEHAYTPPMAR